MAVSGRDHGVRDVPWSVHGCFGIVCVLSSGRGFRVWDLGFRVWDLA